MNKKQLILLQVPTMLLLVVGRGFAQQLAQDLRQYSGRERWHKAFLNSIEEEHLLWEQK